MIGESLSSYGSQECTFLSSKPGISAETLCSSDPDKLEELIGSNWQRFFQSFSALNMCCVPETPKCKYSADFLHVFICTCGNTNFLSDYIFKFWFKVMSPSFENCFCLGPALSTQLSLFLLL